MERRRAAQSREQLAPLLVLLLFARATLAQPAGPEVALATSEPEIRAALLEQRKAILNWDDFQRNQGWRGWDNVSSICNWSGIQCAAGPGGDVTKGFNLSIACDASVTPPVGEACASPAAEGSLAYELAKLAPLQALTVLGMNIDGTLPQAWGDTNSFPSLRLLRLGNNVRSGSFIGPLPDGWGNPRAFPSLRVLDLSGALMPFSLAGQGQPAAPGSSPTTGVDPGTPPGGVRGLPDPWWRLGFLQLEVLSLSRCSVGGFLPDTWLNPKLRSLDLSSNGFKGVLPSGWGNGTLEALQSLKLDLNPNLTGSIPVEWANWSSLTQLDLGGTSICGEVPANASFETVCGDSTNSCLLPTCPEPLESSDGSSAPVGAIVGGVLGGVAALALLAFLALRPGGGWLRRPAVAAAPSAGKGSLGPGLEDSQPSASVDVESGASRALSGGSAGTARLASQGSLLLTDPVLLYVTTNLASMRERQQRMLEASPSGRLRLAAAADAVAGAGAGADASTGVRTPTAAPPTQASASYQSSAGTAQQLPTQAQSGLGEVLTASQRLSSTVKRWEVQWEELRPDKLLGKGSFARVYLAQFRETPVACKLLMTMDECCDSSFILPEKVLNDLEEEAAVLVRMRHPNIVSFMGLCTLPPCIVTEYCSKGSLFGEAGPQTCGPKQCST